jgi:ATP-binding cassette subfamily B protein/ATP-binding cassette subfamily C protein LapB
MNGKMSWEKAYKSLLTHYQLSATSIPSEMKLEEVSQTLLGSDYTVSRMRSGPSSFGVDVDAALLVTADKEWIPIVLYEGVAYRLDEQGQHAQALRKGELDAVIDGLIFYRKSQVRNQLISFYRRNHKKVLQIMACGLLVNVFALSLPLFSSFVYDRVLGNNIHETLWALAVGLLLIGIIDFSLRVLRAHIAEKFSLTAETDIDREVFKSLLASKTQTLPPIGKFLDRYKRLLSSRDLLSSTYLLSLVDVPFLLLFALTVFAVGGAIVLVPLLFGFLMLLGNAIAQVPAHDYDMTSRDADEQKFRLLTDVLSAHEVVVGSGLRRDMFDRWRNACAKLSSHQGLSRYWKSIGLALANETAFLSYVFVIVAGAYLVDARELTAGGLLAISMLSSRMLSGFSSIVTLVTRYRDFRISMQEMDAILPNREQDGVAVQERKLTGRVSFDRVTCRLSENAPPVLKEIDLRINPGEIVGIAGVPGCGKTTLMRLIAGVSQPESGTVLIDHYPATSLPIQDIAANIGYKPQELCLVDGTVEYNVCAGQKNISPERREQALILSGLGWVFQQGGIDWLTEVGPRGSFLSGGQRQLVALARAMMDAKPVLLLDEPTNGLDTHLEAHLAKQIAQLRGTSTIFLSSHSRQMLSICDRIIVIGEGRILANGPREKILAA